MGIENTKTAAELVFFPSPGTGHLLSTVEIAKLLVDRDDRLSITILVMRIPFDNKTSSHTLSERQQQRLKFVNLPQDESTAELLSNRADLLSRFVDWHKPHVRAAVSEIVAGLPESTRLAGFVIDMFCTQMIDVADEFGVPAYVYFTSNASFLGLILHLQKLQDDHNFDVTELEDSDADLAIPTFSNPVPTKILPSVLVEKEGSSKVFLRIAKKLRETKGIMINTFEALEFHAVNTLSGDDKIPPLYPVGPILNLDDGSNEGRNQSEEIMRWLDNLLPSSVVFLCFGSMGSFDETQVMEIATALESSGHRFLWALRRPPPKGKIGIPGDYENPNEVLPEGFLERTAEIGKVIGWAPQVTVLSHPAVGGFVSHCGWNSTLESLWYGVPVVTWPMYAEQQGNAFQMVKEFGLAVEITLDYRKNLKMESNVIVTAAEIEGGIRRLMDGDTSTGIKKKVKEMSRKSRIAVVEGGSSYNSMGRFIED
ncbi:hydroquinone glucosyltransferase, partial [Sarracenia purpurea var. burkii]